MAEARESTVVTTDQWIDVAGVAVSATGPLAVVFLALLANKRFKYFEQAIERQQRVTETRFDLYKDIGFRINDLYAYFNYIGNWKEQSATSMISHKRELDRHVYTYRPIFSDEFNACYDRFILDCFKLYGGWRKDAKLRTSAKHRNEEGEQEWAD